MAYRDRTRPYQVRAPGAGNHKAVDQERRACERRAQRSSYVQGREGPQSRSHQAANSLKEPALNAPPSEMPPQTFKLPLGFIVTFRWSEGKWSVEWDPRMPTGIKSPRHRRKLLAAYHAARAEYFQAIATVMGSGVLILDTHDADSNLSERQCGGSGPATLKYAFDLRLTAFALRLGKCQMQS